MAFLTMSLRGWPVASAASTIGTRATRRPSRKRRPETGGAPDARAPHRELRLAVVALGRSGGDVVRSAGQLLAGLYESSTFVAADGPTACVQVGWLRVSRRTRERLAGPRAGSSTRWEYSASTAVSAPAGHRAGTLPPRHRQRQPLGGRDCGAGARPAAQWDLAELASCGLRRAQHADRACFTASPSARPRRAVARPRRPGASLLRSVFAPQGRLGQ
jgi:hypothetical protein